MSGEGQLTTIHSYDCILIPLTAIDGGNPFLQSMVEIDSKHQILPLNSTTPLIVTVPMKRDLNDLNAGIFESVFIIESDRASFKLQNDTKIDLLATFFPEICSRERYVWNAVCDKIQAESDRRVHPI